jgi:hypothetical protein
MGPAIQAGSSSGLLIKQIIMAEMIWAVASSVGP